MGAGSARVQSTCPLTPRREPPSWPLAGPCLCQRCSHVLPPKPGMLFPETPVGLTPKKSPPLAWVAPGVLNLRGLLHRKHRIL